MSKNDIRKITYGGVLTGLVFVSTMFLKIPNGFQGYINLGDGVIFASALLLGPFAGIVGALGSALADLFAGYPIYAPGTFVIKGVMGLVAGILLLKTKTQSYFYKGLIFLLCEIIMVVGYFLYEILLFDLTIAIPSIFPNIIQAIAGITLGLAAIPIVRAMKQKKQGNGSFV